MLLEERIKEAVEAKFPIQYEPAPGKPKDCRIRIQRQTMMRQLYVGKINREVFDLIKANKDSPTGTITQMVNDYFDNYAATHHDK